ncbi:MAG: DUF86 domain-containing protein [Rhizobiaceae bacterium]|nr:DUF86 domain-containing protein [Rhizobiaceae bacterium]MCV0408658.1 DUF86 domain-containing protein [Rhizobiaceae bacterium]
MASESRTVAERIADILDWGARLERVMASTSRDRFADDEIAQLAAAKCIEAIGEAAGGLPKRDPSIAARHPDLALAEAYRMRNRLSHGYHSIDWATVWDTATIYVPKLLVAVRTIREG